MAGRKSDFTLTKLDDLFSTQEQRDEEKLSKIRDIPLTEIDDFPDHPFKVRDDEDMAQLVESILGCVVRCEGGGQRTEYNKNHNGTKKSLDTCRICGYSI